MLEPKMRQMAQENNFKFPYNVMTLTYNSDERILATPLLKFYLSLGMVVEHVYYAMEFIKVSTFVLTYYPLDYGRNEFYVNLLILKGTGYNN